MEYIEDFLIDKIKEKYIVKEILKMKRRMELLEERDELILKNKTWDSISYRQTLSEDFIREFKDKVSWYYITQYQTLSEDFIREFKDKVIWRNIIWRNISRYQRLSEDFMREFKKKVFWFSISKYQILSEDFMREFKDEVDWNLYHVIKNYLCIRI